MGDLAARLRGRGLALETGPLPAPSPAPGGAGRHGALQAAPASLAAPPAARGAGAARGPAAAAAAAAAGPAALGLSETEKRRLFTPLAEQGSRAMREERKQQQQGEEDLLEGVQATLRRWVQDCLARPEKRDKLLEKGCLKCRVQAKWSEGLHRRLKELAAGYGAKLVADGEKEGASAHPAWLPRAEKWLMAFDAPALEAFLVAHPQALEPSAAQVRAAAEEAAAQGAADVKLLPDALRARFGPLRTATVARARRIAAAPRRGDKRKGGPGGEAGGEEQRARIETPEDVAWAASTLAPLGLRAEGGEPVVRPPAATAVPLLSGLRAVAGMQDLVGLLRETQVGKVVAGLRHHPSAEVAKAAKDLVSSWRAACRER